MSSRLQTSEVLRLTGATARQIEHWENAGHLSIPRGGPGRIRVTKEGTGYYRLWTRREVARVRIIRVLLDAGFELSVAARLARHLLSSRGGPSVILARGVEVSLSLPGILGRDPYWKEEA